MEIRLLSTLKKELIHAHTFHTHEACKSPCLSSLRSSTIDSGFIRAWLCQSGAV